MTIKDIQERLDHYEQMRLAGEPMPEGASFGPPVQIWRRLRDGSESYETLPEWLAEQVVANIPYNEPNTARAKIIRRRAELDSLLMAELLPLMARNGPWLKGPRYVEAA